MAVLHLRTCLLYTSTARNYFFIERYAMLNNEGTWIEPVLKKSAPELEKHIKIGPIPFYEEAEKNKFPIEILTLSVTKSSQHPQEAKEFLTWLSTSEDARDYLEETMGLLSVSGMQDERTDHLSPIASQIKSAVPVSYTHLDVYKRQLQRR